MKRIIRQNCSTTLRSVLFGLASFLALTCTSLQGREIALDLRPAVTSTGGQGAVAGMRPRQILRPASADEGVLRTMILAAGATDVGTVAVGDTLTFTLFDGVELTLSLVKKMPNPGGSDVFLADVSGYDGITSATVIRNANGLTVDISDFCNGKVYRIVSSASGVLVEEREPPKRPHGCGGMLECDLPAATGGRARPMSSLSSASDGECIDILVAYDAAAKTWVDENGGGMQTFAEAQVAKMNTALRNDGLDSYFAFRLVGVMSISESDATLSSALNKVTEGAWSSVRAKRNEVGADLVTMLVDTGSAVGNTGLGWTLRSTSNLSYFKEIAYHTCAIRAVAGDHTMTHEAGHNMGAGHSTADAINTDQIEPGPQYDSYSAGIYFTGTDGVAYHTIMAYNFDGRGNFYSEAPLFSTPHYSWKGVPAGDSTHNNAQTLFNTWKAVSQFRTHVIPFEPDGSELLDVEWTINNGVLTGVKLNGKTDITIPSSVTRIADGLFRNNTSLTSVRFTSDVTIGEQAFKGCTSLSSVTFADGMSATLQTSCFEGTGLTGFTAPYEVTIHGDAFKNCTQLRNATLPSWFRDHPDFGEAQVKQNLFSGCPTDLLIEYFWYYVTVTFDKNDGTGTKMTQRVKIFNDDPLKTIAEIGWTWSGYSFAGWGLSASATSVTYSDGASINTSGNVSLYAIWREGGGSGQGGGGQGGGNSGEVEWIIENRVLVGVNLNGATEIEIPETVTNIAPNVFKDCTGLISVYINSDVESIGAGAFDGCSRLVELWCDRGSKLVSVGANAFRGTALDFLEMPLYTATIGDGVLASCPRLEELWLPYPQWYEYANAQGVQTLIGRLLPSCPASAEIVFYWPQEPVTLMLNDGTDTSYTYFADCERYWENPAYGSYYTDEYMSAIPTPAEIEEETELDGDPLSWSRAGYNFIGWSENPNATEATWADGATFVTTTPRTLYAVWQKIPENPEYTVGLFKVGALQATVKVSGKLTLGRMKYTLPTAANFAPYLKSGETLIGWATAPNALEPEFAPGYTTYISGNTSFYAVYTWFARYNVTYSRNDPTYVDPNAPVKPTWTVIDWTPWFEGTGDDQAAILNQLNSLPQVQQDTALEEYGLFEEYYANLGPVGDPVSETRSFYAFTTNAVLPRITITLPRAADFGWTVEGLCFDKWLDEGGQAYRAGAEVEIAGDTSFSATWAVPPRFMFKLFKNDPSYDYGPFYNHTISEAEFGIILNTHYKNYTILGETADETERLYKLPTAASLGWANSGQLRLVGWEFTDNAGNRITAYDGSTITLRAGWVWTLTAKWGYPVGNNTYLSIDEDGNLIESWYLGDYDSIPASITLPTSVKSLGENSLARLRTKRVVIPNSVTNLGYRVCYCNTDIESVVIPGSVKTIGAEAFDVCYNLREVTIKDGVESIGSSAFASRYNLSGTLTIPSSVTNIGYCAFANCQGLTGLVIRGNDVNVGESAFSGCSALESVSYGGGDIGYRAFAYCSALRRFNFGKVKTIGERAFMQCQNLLSVETGDDLTAIGEYAFHSCPGITRIVLSANLSTMGASAFVNCQNLTSVTVRAAFVPSNSHFSNYETIKYVSLGEGVAPGAGTAAVPAESYSPFRNVFNSADTVVLGHGIATVGASAFYNNIYLKSIRIDGATIGEDAFRGCTVLTNLEFGSGNVTLGTRAFYCDTGLKSVKFGAGNTQVGYGVFAGCSGITEFDFGNVTSLGESAFARCYGLTALDLPDTLSAIGKYTFENCTNIASIAFGTGLSSVGDYAFRYCSGLKSLRFGSALKSIGQEAFLGCSGLTSLKFGAGLQSIGQKAFQNCSGLAGDLVIDNADNATIGKYAFNYAGFTSVTLGSGVISVGDCAFADCTELLRATLGCDIESVGRGAFARSLNMRSLWLLTTKPNPSFGTQICYQNTVVFCSAALANTDAVVYMRDTANYPYTNHVKYPYVIIDPANGKNLTSIVYNPPSKQGLGFVVYPDAVILEIPPSVTSVTVSDGSSFNTANIRVVSGDADITSSLGAIPAANNGQISLGAVSVKPEVVEAALDVEQGAVIEMNPEEPVLTTSETVPGLTYTLIEGASLEDMKPGDHKVGDGTKWTPNVTVKGGRSGFYTIRVTK